MFSKVKKIISMLIIFVMTMTYSGTTLQALAAEDEISAITNGFFDESEMKFKAYFNEKDKKSLNNVNEKAVLKFEISPNNIGRGFLKLGKITALGIDGNNSNFRFLNVKNVITDEPEEVTIENPIEEPENEEEIIEDEEEDELIKIEDGSADSFIVEDEPVNETNEVNTINEQTNTTNIIENSLLTNETNVENRISNRVENVVNESKNETNTANEVRPNSNKTNTTNETNSTTNTDLVNEIIKTIANNTSENVVSNSTNNISRNVTSRAKGSRAENVDVNTIEENINTISSNVVNEVKNENIVNEITNTTNEIENENIVNEITNTTNEVKNENIVNEITNTTNEIKTENVVNEIENTVNNETTEVNTNTVTVPVVEEEKFVEEDKEIEEIEETYEELTAKEFEIAITADNEITIQNVIYNTVIEVEIEFIQKDKMSYSDIYEEVELRLEGTYINTDLERIEIQNTEKITIGWVYSKEFEIASKYTKASPFRLGDTSGIIVENNIIVSRNIEDEKYLPVKETKIEVEVPEFNGVQPKSISVHATKLMMTKGQDVSEVEFSKDNWEYNEGRKKLTITVSNEENIANLLGEDEYIIVYRYDSYTEDEEVTFDNKFKITVEEYSSNNNVVTKKDWETTETIKTIPNDLITYNITSDETVLNKSKINANYNTEDVVYETEFKSVVGINILTGDLLEEFVLDCSKENYKLNDGTTYDASGDVYYNKVKFYYSELKEILQNGASIEIKSKTGELLYTLYETAISSEDDCEITLPSKEHGIDIVLKNASTSGNLSIELTKAIGRSSYTKALFTNFKELESTVSAGLKYAEIENSFSIAEISVSKKLENSKTSAELSIASNILNTASSINELELRIELNNDKQDSDLYENPSFELVFPKYIKNVKLTNIGMIYNTELNISRYEIFKEEDITKMKIDVSGIQTKFSESTLTNGTNIVINLIVELDEFTPKKKDQIKMYYYNEGVTTYESQTTWKINKEIPAGIIKDTNGYDSEIIEYEGASGLITSNAIINYDGQGSKIGSIGQGEKVAEVYTDSASQIATMELVAINNTGNSCIDTVFLGRIPFEGNRSVITNENLGTTVNTTMLGTIKENIQNSKTATIYYSTNERPTKSLVDSKNNWVTDPADITAIKSYMIIVKGKLNSGDVLKYTYDFEIPSGLPYDAAIYGSFGANFNNELLESVSYQSTEADKVGLVTEKTPELKISVAPFGENQNIYYGQVIELQVKVENNTNHELNETSLDVSIPTGTVFVEHEFFKIENDEEMYQRYVEDPDKTKISFPIFLKVGEVATYSFKVKVLDNEEESTTLVGNVKLNETVKKYSLKAKKSNILVNAKCNNLDIDIIMSENSRNTYQIDIKRLNSQSVNENIMEFKIPNYIKIDKIIDSNENEFRYINTDNMISVNIGNATTIFVKFTIENLKIEKSIVKTVFNVREKNSSKKYSSNPVEFKTEKSFLEIEHSLNKKEFAYGDSFEYTITVKNKSYVKTSISLKNKFPEYFCFKDVKIVRESGEENIKTSNNLNMSTELNEKEEIKIIATGDVVDWGNENKDREFSNTISLESFDSKGIYSRDSMISNEIQMKINKIDYASENNIKTNEEENSTEKEMFGYYISGNVYVDENENGTYDISEKNIENQAQVQLYKDSKMVRATTTDANGNYSFDELENGNYTVLFNYDQDTYKTTISTQAQDKATSKSVEIARGTSVTDMIKIENNSAQNVNAGLQEVENFDLEISQYVSKADVFIKDKDEISYSYDENTDLSKIEIEPSDLKKSNIKLEYKIIVTNVGNVSGQATSIVDFIPNGMIFDQSENLDWSIGTINGNVYYDGLKGVNIAPGESKVITLILNKKMTDESTCIFSNKVGIAYTESSSTIKENKENNFATHETIITLTQGLHRSGVAVISISLLIIITFFAYMIKTEKIDVDVGKLIKKIYR